MWPRMPEVWVPLGLDPNVGRRDARMLRVLGRLRPDVTRRQARAELDVDRGGARASNIRTRTGHRCERRRPARAADARRPPVALRARRRGDRAAAGGVRQRGRTARRRRARAPARVRDAPGARRQPGAHRPADRRREPDRRAARGRRRVRAGLWARTFSSARPLRPRVPRASEISVGPPTFVVGVVLSLACTTVCALVAALRASRAPAICASSAAPAASTSRPGRRARSSSASRRRCRSRCSSAPRFSFAASTRCSSTDPGFESTHVWRPRGCRRRRPDIPPGLSWPGSTIAPWSGCERCPGVERRRSSTGCR